MSVPIYCRLSPSQFCVKSLFWVFVLYSLLFFLLFARSALLCSGRSSTVEFMGVMGRMEKESLSDDMDMMSENKKCCLDCKTTKTPLWRGGPAGPKSLCNACGIRYRKKKNAMVGLSVGSYRKRNRTHVHGTCAYAATSTTSTSATSVGNGGRELSMSLKAKFMELGKDLLLKRSPSVMKKQRWQGKKRKLKLKEEEQAAVSLMALSTGSVFALT